MFAGTFTFKTTDQVTQDPVSLRQAVIYLRLIDTAKASFHCATHTHRWEWIHRV